MCTYIYSNSNQEYYKRYAMRLLLLQDKEARMSFFFVFPTSPKYEDSTLVFLFCCLDFVLRYGTKHI